MQALHTDDGIVLRVPDTDEPPPAGIAEFEPDELEPLITAELGGSALFASRFRECAARALLLPRRQPGRRSPLWQQRQRSAHLLAVAARYGTFPIVLETVRECVQDVFDVPALTGLMRDLAGRKVRLVEVETPAPSPFGRVAAVPVRRRVHVRGRLAAGRAARPGAGAGLLAARRAARPGGPAGTARSRGGRADAERTAAAGPRPRLPRPRGGRGPAAHHRAAVGGRGRRAMRRARRGARAGWPSWRRSAGRSRCGSAARRAGRRSRTRGGCATRSGCRCRSACRPRSPSRCRTRWKTWWPGTRAATARSPLPTWRAATASGRRWSPARCGGWRRRAGSSEGEFLPGGQGAEWCDAEVLRLLRRRCLARLRKEAEPVAPGGPWRVPARLAERRSAGQGRRLGRGPAGAGGRPGRTRCTTRSSSSPGRLCRPPRWRR